MAWLIESGILWANSLTDEASSSRPLVDCVPGSLDLVRQSVIV